MPGEFSGLHHSLERQGEAVTLLRLLEQQLLDPQSRKDPAALAALLAEDFREFGSSGRIFTKAEIILLLAAEPSHVIIMDDFDCQLLAATVALVTYRSTTTIGSGGNRKALRSSVWVLREARWQMLFHQGTTLIPPEAQRRADAVS